MRGKKIDYSTGNVQSCEEEWQEQHKRKKSSYSSSQESVLGVKDIPLSNFFSFIGEDENNNEKNINSEKVSEKTKKEEKG